MRSLLSDAQFKACRAPLDVRATFHAPDISSDIRLIFALNSYTRYLFFFQRNKQDDNSVMRRVVCARAHNIPRIFIMSDGSDILCRNIGKISAK
jgi:hypothetical protein